MERLTRALLVALLTVTITSGCAVSQTGGLAVEPALVLGKYCSDLTADGTLVFRATVRFKYHNNGDRSILLPRFPQVAGYMLYRDEQSVVASRPDGRERLRLTQYFDAAKLDRAKPDSQLFDLMERGGSQTRTLQVFIVLGRSRIPGRSLLGSDLYLRVNINHWFGSRREGRYFQQRWREIGLLWIENILSPPLRLRIDKDPIPQRCQGSID